MKDKLQFPFKRKGGNYLELLEDLGKDTMLGVKTVRATARNTAIYFDDDGYTIQDAKKLARAIHDTYSDVTATADLGRNPYGEKVPFVFVDKVNSFTRESKMKKLNITKEAFEKSRYFTKKYGKLEYMSESGKLFKTEKGNVLKFVKESCDEEFDRYYERMKKIFRYDSGIHIRLRDNEDGSETIEVTFDDRFNWNDDVVSGRIPLDEDSGLLDWITRWDEIEHRYGWKFDYEIAKDIEHPIDGGANNDYLAMLTLTCKCDKEEDDLLFESSDEKLDNPEALIKFIRGLPDGDEYLFQDGGKWIATNEWLCGTFSGQGFEGDTEEEAVQKLIDYLNLHIGHKSMVGQNVTKSGWPIASKVAEYVVPEEEEVDESAMPLKESNKKLGKKFGKKFKESVDITTDPAYVCPYCGSRNCEFDDAEDLGSGLQEGYFEGATFNAQFWCNECNKPYNVTYELKVKEVYPNEDVDELSDDWA